MSAGSSGEERDEARAEYSARAQSWFADLEDGSGAANMLPEEVRTLLAHALEPRSAEIGARQARQEEERARQRREQQRQADAARAEVERRRRRAEEDRRRKVHEATRERERAARQRELQREHELRAEEERRAAERARARQEALPGLVVSGLAWGIGLGLLVAAITLVVVWIGAGIVFNLSGPQNPLDAPGAVTAAVVAWILTVVAAVVASVREHP